MRILTPLLFLSLMACPKSTPTNPAANEATAQESYTGELPVDPGVRMGTLPNGMKWYIETNQEPANRAVFRLAVDVGSINEDDDQLGLAHLLEHMAFNGSENFEGNELIEYLESVGTRFGAHLNAHTSTDETVYKLTVPTDDAEVWDTAFLVFQDWAGGITNSDQAIEDERGVVLEEWRSRRGAGARIGDVMRPLYWKDTLYVDRKTIGTEESLKTFTPEAVRRFYNDWYRPDLMAIIVVGDVDPDDVQARIEKHFGGLTMPENPRERIRPEIPGHDETLVMSLADPELTQTSASIIHKHDSPHENTHEAYRLGFVDSLITAMLNERFRDMATKPDAPFLGASSGQGRLAPQEGYTRVASGSPEGEALEGLRAIATEMERVRRHGFLQGELDRAAMNQMRSMEAYYNERETTHSARHADEIVRVFLTGESMPGIAYEWELSQVFLEDISLEEVNARAATHFMAEDSRIISVTQPEKEGLELPTEAQIRAVIAEVEASEIGPPEDEAITGPLLAELPTPGTVVSKEEVPELQAHKWVLSNGIEVWLRPSDFKADQIMLRSFSPGGHGGIAMEQYVPATTATGLVSRSGVADYSARQIAKYLSGKQASASPWVSTWYEGMSGSASPEDLSVMFELVHLGFTAPRFDSDAFEVAKRGRIESLRNRLSNPNTLYRDKWNSLLYSDHPRMQPWTMETIDQMDLAASEAFYKERFADASDFTFVMVGNFDLETIEPLLTQYLATLPTVEREDVQTDPQMPRAQGVHTAVVNAGLEPKARWEMEIHGDFDGSWQERTTLSALREVLSVRLRKKLREEMGGVYGVSVSASTWTLPEQGYRLGVGFTCDPERVDELAEATWEILNEVQANGVLEAEVADVKAKNTRSMEESVETNQFYMGIQNALRRGDDPREMMNYTSRIEALSAEGVSAMASWAINPDQYINVTLLPEEGAAE